MGQQEVEMARLHTHVIIIVGNNDLSQWKNLPVYTLLQTATNLFNFVNLLRNIEQVVALVGVLKPMAISFLGCLKGFMLNPELLESISYQMTGLT